MSKMIDPLLTGWWLNQLKNISQNGNPDESSTNRGENSKKYLKPAPS